MPVYSAFTIPTLGMRAQSHSLATIGNNIANVTTGGFRRTDTNFSTVLGRTLGNQSDIGGVKPKDLNQITQQGNLSITNRDLDLAINGHGFFIFNSTATGGGQRYYGRDGSFEMATVNNISVTGNGGSIIAAKDGYLVDKNGYFLQGWAADPLTGLFSSTALTSLRIDPYAFAKNGQTTTVAALEMNLPSTDNAGLPHVTEVSLVGAVGVPEIGDTYSVTVEGTTVTYTVDGTEANLNAVRDALIGVINGNATISALATASASPSDNKLLLTGVKQGIALTISSLAGNGGATADNTAKSAIVQTAEDGDIQVYNIEVFDLNGNSRSVRLDFTKTAANTWDLSTTVGKTPIAQVDTLTLAGTIEAGDVYSVVVDGTTFSTTVGVTDTLATISADLVSKINANTALKVTAAPSGINALTLTADIAGTPFITSTSTVNRTPVSQIDNVTLTDTYAVGDTISVQIDALAPVVYTVVANDLSIDGIGGAAVAGNSTAAYNNITNKIKAQIDADVATSNVVTAADSGGGTGIITLQAVNPGTAFTQTTSATPAITGVATPSTPTPSALPLKQIDNATLTGVYAPGDTISVNINAIGAVIYTVVPNDLTLNGIGGGGPVAGNSAAAYNNITTKIAAAIVADGPTAAVVSAAATGGGGGVVTLTAVTAGNAFAQVTSATTAGSGAAAPTTPAANLPAVAQIDNLTLTSTYAAGDLVSVKIDGLAPVTYTVVTNDLTANGNGTGGVVAGNSAAAYNNITAKIAAAIIGDGPTAAVVTAVAPGGGGGIVSLTAVTGGTAFTQVTSSSRGASSVATASTPTENLAALADNTATNVNTTANIPATDSITNFVTTMTFDANGSLLTPTTGAVNLDLILPGVGSVPASSATVALDISKFTQFAGNFQPYSYTNNGFSSANAQSIRFDTKGQVIASFDDGSHRTVYKIPLAQFSNANALQEYNGNVYRETEESGIARVVDADKTGYASFLPTVHELSNVDLAGEFTRMMMTQTAYNSSATVFKTVDEMIIAARDLKR